MWTELREQARRHWRHAWTRPGHVRRAIGSAGLQRLEEAVRESEARHLGQICVCIEAGLPAAELHAGRTPRERAMAVFSDLRVWDTEHNNGVLIYLLMADRAIEIVSDRGLNRHVSLADWQLVAQNLGAAFRQGRFEHGLVEAINAVDDLLTRHYPRHAGSPASVNELSDVPRVI